ncbi:MAG: TonB-dependent receptor [Bacteroidetes bacterium]|nr:TonB-dependent receptor [Bacteroidota bacterium]
MKNYLTRSLIFIAVFMATLPAGIYSQQDNQGQSIELPDFVITGVQSVTIPKMEKNKPSFISTISDEFFRPKLINEEFSDLDRTEPIQKEKELLENFEVNNGILKLGAGIRTLPLGEFIYSTGWENFMLNTHVWGSDVKEYVDYAGYNVSGASAIANIFVSNKSDFLPGLNISVKGKLYRDKYNLYNSLGNYWLRETDNIFGNVLLSNFLNKSFKYSLNLYGTFIDLKPQNIEESVYKGSASIEFNFWGLSLGGSGGITSQSFDSKFLINDTQNYYDTEFNLGFTAIKNLKLNLGVNYSKQDTNNLLAPKINFVYSFDKSIHLIAEYSPHAQFNTMRDFIDSNPYFAGDYFKTIFTKYKKFAKVALKFEYLKYFEIDGGMTIAEIDGLYFMQDLNNDGRFELYTSNNVNDISAFLKFMFHQGPYGYFYGDLIFRYATEESSKRIPYIPIAKSALEYGYNYDFGFTIKTKVNAAFSPYTDLTNSEKLPNYYNLACYLNYSLVKNFDITFGFENLLNRDNYILKGYQEKPFDIIFGIDYRW